MRRALLLALFMISFVGCAADEVGSDHGTFEDPSLIGKSSQPITVSEMMVRAEEWVTLRVPYCGGIRGGTDYICGGTCSRPAAPWDKYRTDCSGFVSWCWQIASNPTTSVFMSDRSGADGWTTVSVDALTAGDAVVCNGHIKLFSKFVSATSAEIYEEYDCGKVARKAVQSFARSGDTIKFSGDSRVYHGIRRNNVTSGTVVKGYLDKADTTVEGWAIDMNATGGALSVELDLDAVRFTAKADLPRADVATSLGVDPNHGYSLTTPLFFCDGRPHTVRATTKGVTLASTPKSLECALPAVLPGVLRHVANPASFGAWKFNELAQLRWVSIADAAKYEQVGELPAGPDLRRTPDGRVWVIDGTARRPVSDAASFAAWGFDDKAVIAATDGDLSKYNEGPALPGRPVLIKSVADPAVFVLDTRGDTPEAPLPDPATPPGATPQDPETGPTGGETGDSAMTGSCATHGPGSPVSSGFALLALAASLAGLRKQRVVLERRVDPRVARKES
jgi:hypothetical protein